MFCLDAKTGDVIWKHEYDFNYTISYPAGPRCTPTVEGGKVFTLGAMGDLVIARLSPERYEEVGRAKLLDPLEFLQQRAFIRQQLVKL